VVDPDQEAQSEGRVIALDDAAVRPRESDAKAGTQSYNKERTEKSEGPLTRA
jgi:hypothetical protein